MKKHTMFKRGLAVALVGMMALGLAACGSSSDSSSDDSSAADETEETSSTEGVTIEFQQWWGDELPDGMLDEIVAAFTEETGIEVELLTAPWADTKTAITSGAATGTVADVVAVDSAWLVDFADQGIITDLDSLFETYGVDTSLFSSTWESDGTTYAVPLLNFAYPLYVNMDILEAAGVESVPTTWSEMLEACQQITAAGYEALAVNLGTQSPNGICNVIMGMASASGITMANDDGTYTMTENDELATYLEYVKELWDDGSICSEATTLEESAMTSNFTAGNYAFCIASMSMLSDFTDAGLNVECAAIPVQDGYEGQSGMMAASWALGVSESSENKEACAEFISYLFGGADGTDGSYCAEMAVAQSAFPGSTVADPDYSEAADQFQTVYELWQAGYSENQFIGIPETETVETDMTNALIQYLQGDIDLDECLSLFQTAYDDVQ